MGAGAGGLTSQQTESLMEEAVLYTSDGTATHRAVGKMLKSLVKMRKAGVPLAACVQRAQIKHGGWQEGLSEEDIARFVTWCERRGQITAADIAMAFPGRAIGTKSLPAHGAERLGIESSFKPSIEVLEKYRVALGGNAPSASAYTKDAIPLDRLELIRQAFAGRNATMFSNLRARDALQGMFKGIKVMRCSAEALEQYCTRWRNFNCDDNPVDQIAVELWLEMCLPAWRNRTAASHPSKSRDSASGGGGESQRK